MDLQLVGKTALVIGTSIGIGCAIAKGLATEGVQVAVVARRTPLLAELAAEIERGQGPRPLLIAQGHYGRGCCDEIARCCARRSRAIYRHSSQLHRKQPSITVGCLPGKLGGSDHAQFSPGSARSFTRCFRR